jgi:hypothetical protein
MLHFYEAKVVYNQQLSESLATDFFALKTVVAVDGAHYRDLRISRKIFFHKNQSTAHLLIESVFFA